jgi:hypothetical protein
LARHHAVTTVSLLAEHDSGAPPPSSTIDDLQYGVTVTPQGAAGWTGTPNSLREFIVLTGAHLERRGASRRSTPAADAATVKLTWPFPRVQRPVVTSLRHKPRSTICAILCASGAKFAAHKAPGSAPHNRRSARPLAPWSSLGPVRRSGDLARDPPERLPGERAFPTTIARPGPLQLTKGSPDAETEPLVGPDRLSIRRSGDGVQLAASSSGRVACGLLVEQSGVWQGSFAAARTTTTRILVYPGGL